MTVNKKNQIYKNIIKKPQSQKAQIIMDHLSKNKNSHRCQIDCSNHDQVVNSLEMKSKDLYFFWRNYQWLYNKYYNQKQQPKNVEPAAVDTRQFEQEISSLNIQIRKLKVQNQSLRRQIQLLNSNTSNKKVQIQFQKQIDRLNSKCQNYENIRQKLTNEINQLKLIIKSKIEDVSSTEDKYKREMKKQQGIIIDLQKNIDELRNRLMQNNSSSETILQVQEKYRREIQKVMILVQSLQEKAQWIIEQQFQKTKTQLYRQLPNIITKFATGDLRALIIQQQVEQEQN